MSNRFCTTITVSGPNAATAEKAAIEALRDLSKDDKPPRWSSKLTPEKQEAQWEQKVRGFWYDVETVNEWEKGARDGSKVTHEEAEEYRRELRDGEVTPHFFDHCSGDAAIYTVAIVSHNYPSETFELSVDGGMAEGIQGPVYITNGKVRDGRSSFISYGEPLEPFCEKCNGRLEPSPMMKLATEHKIDGTGHIECTQCHTVYEYEVKHGELVSFVTEYEVNNDTAKV